MSEFDVFLCHNSQDKPEVEKIAKELQKQGITPWLDKWELRPGFPWQRELETQIEYSEVPADCAYATSGASRLTRRCHVGNTPEVFGTQPDNGLTQRLWHFCLYPLGGGTRAAVGLAKAV
ncbi:MAG: toll/interleukin-1 receptor domain-containing protein [Calothrix sp. MO_192.B10]|nr:toll/interleukin-1 receptor domain-containing protein [Calothrix sp. MO_192.B10]